MQPEKMIQLPPPTGGKPGWPWAGGASQAQFADTPTIDWPKISVVTPSFNQGQFLEQTIRSVLLQNYPNLEYIIIDGGSQDNSVDIIRKYQRFISYWVSEPDRGQSHAINKGFKKATGELLAWLNSDDYYEPNALFHIAQAAIDNTEAVLIFGGIRHVDQNGDLLTEGRHIQEFDRQYMLNEGNLIGQPSAFFRRDAFTSIGGIDEDLNNVMDWDLWLRLDSFGDVTYIPEKLSNLRIYPDTKTASTGRPRYEEIIRVIQRNGGQGLPAYYQAELLSVHQDKAFSCFHQGEATEGENELAYIKERITGWDTSSPAFIQDLSDFAWNLFEENTTEPEVPLQFIERVSQHLPEKQNRAIVRKQCSALIYQALAHHYHRLEDRSKARQYALRALRADRGNITNVGLLKVLINSLLGN